MRLTYPATTTAQVLVNTSRSATGNRSGSITISGSTVTGTFTGGGFCGSSKTFQIFYRDAVRPGADQRRHLARRHRHRTARPAPAASTPAAALTFDTTAQPRSSQVKVGISFVSMADAAGQPRRRADRVRLRRGLRTAADTAWNNILNRVQVTGGSAADLQKFYTALYHVLQNPNIASDVNGQYRGFDNADPHREPPRLPELLRLGHLPVVGVADRADRAGRGHRHRQVDGARRPAGRPAARSGRTDTTSTSS